MNGGGWRQIRHSTTTRALWGWLFRQHGHRGEAIHLALPEMGLDGPATVLAIEPCPSIAPDTGTNRAVVTGTMKHLAGNLLDVHVAGLEDPIGVTDTHPFWSEDRQDFIPARQLQVGEHLRRADGTLAQITRITPRRGPPEVVYNLEVDGEHVFHVTAGGVLVHNSCGHVDGGDASVDEALDGALQYLGPRYRDMGNGRFLSEDGLRQVRMGRHELADPNNLHIHLEHYDTPWDQGGHVVESTFTKIQ